MKKENIHAQSYFEFIEKLEAAILDHLTYIIKTDPEFGYVRLVSDNPVSIFIRMLPTYNYFDDENAIFINAYIHNANDKVHPDHLMFSERLTSDMIDIYINTLVTIICNDVFEITAESSKFEIQILSGIKSLKVVELESMYPKPMKDIKTFSKFICSLLKGLNNHLPTLLFYTHSNIIKIVDKNASLFDDGVHYLSFTYFGSLSDKLGYPVYLVHGIIPSIYSGSDDGRLEVNSTVPFDSMEEFIYQHMYWYFSLKSVLLPGESMELYIEEIPYFQQII